MHSDPMTLSVREAHEAMKKGELTPLALAHAYLEHAKTENARIHAYLEFFDDIKEQAAHAAKLFKEGKESLMTGIPVAVKDNILIKGKVASGASKILEQHVAVYDATVIARLRAVGAIFIGRTNMDEFAMGSTTENSAYGVTKNPRDESRVAGGTSGGSAAAVAMGGALVALGSDTGGSVRLPASFCGLVGLKPTYGAVSRYGLMATASSLDQIGTLGRTVDEARELFLAVKGFDTYDSTSIPDESYSALPAKAKLRIGVPRKFVDVDGLSDEVRSAFEQTLAGLKKAGHTIVDVELPRLKYALPAYYIINPAEISANLARYDGIRYGYSSDGNNLSEVYLNSRGEGFGPEVKRRILLGTYILSAGYYDAYYNKANSLREIIRKDLDKVFEDVDVIVMPTAPTPPYKIGEKSDDPLAMYLGDIFTVTANVAGVPALSVPMGTALVDGKALPLGIQFMASGRGEELLFAAGRAVELL
jgi:aspartyl-tRNA(Asn)/glutamyl-tRNA(Gln) amidotransferase subunit A